MNEEDTELRDLISQTLENNGVLPKIRAELRASVFLALEDHESKSLKRHGNKELQEFLKTHNGLLIFSLIKDFLHHFNLDKTSLVLEPELGISCDALPREALVKEMNFPVDRKGPILSDVLQKALSTFQSQAGKTSHHNTASSGIPKDLTPAQVEDAKKKFRYYDKDNNNLIDKAELRQLFRDMFPAFNQNMIDRYVNDEFRAGDLDFSNSIDIDEFLGMYKRLFIQCRAVVASDMKDILPETSLSQSSPPNAESSSKSTSAKKTSALKPLGGKTGSISEDDVSFEDSSLNLSANGKANRGGGLTFGVSPSDNSVPRSPSATSGSRIPKFRGTGYSSDKSKGFSDPPKSSSATSLKELPPLGGTDSLKGSFTKSKTEPSHAETTKKMKDFSFDDLEDFDYQDDFDDSMKSASQHKTLSARNGQGDKSNLPGRDRSQSIEEEIEEALDDDDDLFNSHSALDDMTNDVTVDSDRSLGVDYVEDLLKK